MQSPQTLHGAVAIQSFMFLFLFIFFSFVVKIIYCLSVKNKPKIITYPSAFSDLRYFVISSSLTVSMTCCNAPITDDRSFGRYAVTG